ncbi:MAG: tyrosine-type recombinase/integrase, partial [Alphaproteobacteria bacterium]|nr:tyrosine-type recombinase/integrase [Alphaproteobacteria bacterium]
ELPVHQELKAMLDGMEKTATVILTTETGRPWRGGHFRSKWREVTLRAGLDGLHFHDLRGTAATRLQEAGCSDREIAAITGHTGSQISAILDKYVARRRSVAVAAMRKFENAEGTGLQTIRPMLQTVHAKPLKKKR